MLSRGWTARKRRAQRAKQATPHEATPYQSTPTQPAPDKSFTALNDPREGGDEQGRPGENEPADADPTSGGLTAELLEADGNTASTPPDDPVRIAMVNFLRAKLVSCMTYASAQNLAFNGSSSRAHAPSWTVEGSVEEIFCCS